MRAVLPCSSERIPAPFGVDSPTPRSAARGSIGLVAAAEHIHETGPERTHVRFVGGPWDAMASYYFGLEERPPMPCADGAYVFESAEPGGVVYAFHYGVRTST
jgi:hypothetical protein